MPRGNGTGPNGMGSMTGRAAGYCAGYGAPGYANVVPGRGFSGGFGRGCGAGGRGWRNMYHATGLTGWMRFGGSTAAYGPPASYRDPDPEAERRVLRRQAAAMQAELDALNRRLGELGAETEDA